ncbi:MAG: phosphate ABC transporter permease PstA [Spirochaetes bacterium]|nr:phosphate ABC transporter permease PstA [Spirochaetota bacterium]
MNNVDTDKHFKLRKLKNKVFKYFLYFLSGLSIIPLILIILHIIKNGISAVNIKFFTSMPKPVGESGGGILNAIVGTLMLVTIASVMAIPVGISTGIYLNEHRKNRLSYYIQLSAEVLQSIPSIVIGIVAWIWIVLPMGHFSALSGGIALGIMMLPTIIKSTEETLKLIPHSLKEASLALGVPYYKTILKVLLPASLSGIVTGILIGIARIAGETAPLLFTAFGNPFLNFSITKPVASLPLLIFNYATSPYDDWHKIAWGASLVLITFIFTLNIFTRLFTKKYKVKF